MSLEVRGLWNSLPFTGAHCPSHTGPPPMLSCPLQYVCTSWVFCLGLEKFYPQSSSSLIVCIIYVLDHLSCLLWVSNTHTLHPASPYHRTLFPFLHYSMSLFFLVVCLPHVSSLLSGVLSCSLLYVQHMGWDPTLRSGPWEQDNEDKSK